MIHWANGVVRDVLEHDEGIQYVEVEMENKAEIRQAIHFTDWFSPLKKGDQVILNTTAVDLSLGSGGYHFVVWKKEGSLPAPRLNGHIMKLRYTPWQLAVQAVEEERSPYHNVMREATHLADMPVLVGELHSMLPILVASLHYLAHRKRRTVRIGYIMTDGAALSLKLSRHVKHLTKLGWLTGTVTCGHAFGGDLEAVNIYSGLLAAKHVLKADVAVVLMGPGIVGTGTPYGFSGVEQGQIANAVHTLNGQPIVVPRISFADFRKRHRGVSHHTLTNLNSVILHPVRVPVPLFADEGWRQFVESQMEGVMRAGHELIPVRLTVEDVRERLKPYPSQITSMGRGLDEDPAFFLGVSAAANVCWSLL